MKEKGLFRYQYMIPVLLTVALALALAGCTKAPPHPTIAKPGNEVDLNLTLPETVSLPAETKGTIYESVVDPEASLERAAALLGVSKSDIHRKENTNDTEKYVAYTFPDG